MAWRLNKLRPLDFVLIGAACAASLAPLLLISGSGGDTVAVTCQGVEIYRGSVNSDVVITTPDGHNTIEINHGRAFMRLSDCPDQTCVHMGDAQPGRPVVCVPNEVLIVIEDVLDVDGVTG